jgi:hypothetical protein
MYLSKMSTVNPYFIRIVLFGLYFSWVSCTHGCNAQTPVDFKIGGLPVIKGVVGYGLDSKGRSDGVILKVTNLNKQGQGSLAEALSHKDPRIIVFEVAGIIDLIWKGSH